MERETVIGTETELGLQIRNTTGQDFTSPEFLRRYYSEIADEIFQEGLHTLDLRGVLSSISGIWTRCHKIYRDSRGHLEVATPETLSLDDAVKYEVAGRREAKDIFNLYLLKKGYEAVLFLANNTDYTHNFKGGLNVWGYHENLSFTEAREYNLDFLLPFLVTRQIYTGAGAVLPKAAEESVGAKFVISPRTVSLAPFSTNLSNNKVSLSIRNTTSDTLVVATKGARLHSTLGESNISEEQTKLKLGTLLLVHRLLMDGWKPPDFLNVSVEEFCDIGRFLAKACNGNFNWFVNFGIYSIHATDVQRIYLEEAERRFGNNGDSDTQWTLKKWKQTLGILDKDPLDLSFADWVLKYKLYEKLERRGWKREDLVKADMMYHAIDPELDNDLFRQAGGKYLFTDSEIQKAMFNPPKNTRAYGRSLAVNALYLFLKSKADSIFPLEKPSITWSGVSMGEVKLNLDSPLITYNSEAMEFEGKLFSSNISPEGSVSQERK